MARDTYLRFSEEIVELSLTPGGVKEGFFALSGNDDMPLKGFVTSHDVRMRCKQLTLDPTECTVKYVYDATGLEVGDEDEGSFTIVTNQGEAELQYHVSVISPAPVTSMGQITSMYQFVKLAKKNWTEAVHFFGTTYFADIVSREDVNLACLYNALKDSPDLELACEEFLIKSHKKEAYSFDAETHEVNLVSALDISQERISIIRDGWGYSRLNIRVEGDFLSVEKHTLDHDDFLGNRATFNIYLNPGRLHAGKNFGRVVMDNAYTHLEVPVCIVHIKELAVKGGSRYKDAMLRSIDNFIDYRLGKLDYEEFVRLAESIFSEVSGSRRDNLIRDLSRISILISEGRLNEGRFLLDHTIKKLDFDKLALEEYCHIRYLEYKAGDSQTGWKRVYEDITSAYRREPENWKVAWFIIELLKERPASREIWQLLNTAFDRGSRSPLLYTEAVKYLEENISRMTNPTEFVIQTLHFAARRDYLTEDMIFQIHYLVGRIKKFNPLVVKILEKCYEIKQDDESLFALCCHIMLCDRMDDCYFRYFEAAVARQLRVGGLYENYLACAMNLKKRSIHENAVRYLFYQDTLTLEQKAYLYAFIVRNRNEKPEIFELFSPEMTKFSVDSFSEGYINFDLAELYKYYIRGAYVPEDKILHFISIFSTSYVKILKKDCHRVICTTSMYENKKNWRFETDERFITVWDQDAMLAVVDEKGQRFAGQGWVESRPLFSREEIINVVSRIDSPVREVLMNIFVDSFKSFVVSEKNIDVIQKFYDSSDLSKVTRARTEMLLLQYYGAQEMGKDLDDLLSRVSAENYSPSQRCELINIMCQRGLFEKAFSWVISYGTAGVSSYHLTSICHNLIDGRAEMPRENLLKLTYNTYLSGYYTKRMLVYLARHFAGTCNQLWKLWKACDGFLVESQELNEKLLKRITHTGKHMDDSDPVFASYSRNGGDLKVALAYLSVRCADYYKSGAQMGDDLMVMMKKLYYRGVELPDAVQLALLKYMSVQEEISTAESDMITKMVENFVFGKEVFLDFFKSFVRVCPIVAMYQDKTVLEYTSKYGGKVILHYVAAYTGDGEEPLYVASELTEEYNGTYTKEFVLFFGEKIDYYITEITPEGERMTGSGTLECQETSADGPLSRYAMINRMNVNLSLGNIAEAARLHDKYQEKQMYSDKLFSLQ